MTRALTGADPPSPRASAPRDPARVAAECARLRREMALRTAEAARSRAVLLEAVAAPPADPAALAGITMRCREAGLRSAMLSTLLRVAVEDQRQNEFRWRARQDGLLAASGFSAAWNPCWVRPEWERLTEAVDDAASLSIHSGDPAPAMALLQRWGADPRLVHDVAAWIVANPEQLRASLAAGGMGAESGRAPS